MRTKNGQHESPALPLPRAQQLAQVLVDDLAPGCQRIEITGEVRRRRPEIKVIELLAIPKYASLLDDDTNSVLDQILDTFRMKRQLVPISDDHQKHKSFYVPESVYAKTG